nr:methylated-DNA--[protein]-cysteine S-methyltransferase [candidate division Zixibacteria bacterium]
MKELYVHEFNSAIGWIYLGATAKGLAIIALGNNGQSAFKARLKRDYDKYEIIPGGSENLKAEKQISLYLGGQLRKFDLELDLNGTPFQLKVLKRVAAIPYGSLATYGQIAAAIGNPGASRAVGSANARNRLPLVIPCHRVVASNGPGGYGGGLELKRRLLEIEGIQI